MCVHDRNDVVIAILAAISTPVASGLKDAAYDRSVQSDLKNIGINFESHKQMKWFYPTPNNINASDLGITLSKNAYSESGLGQSGAYNFMYCHNNDGGQEIALIAKSKSDNMWQYYGGKVSEYTGTRSTNGYLQCRDAGAPIWGSNDNDRTLLRAHSGNWVNWVRGTQD